MLSLKCQVIREGRKEGVELKHTSDTSNIRLFSHYCIHSAGITHIYTICFYAAMIEVKNGSQEKNTINKDVKSECAYDLNINYISYMLSTGKSVFCKTDTMQIHGCSAATLPGSKTESRTQSINLMTRNY